MFTKTKAGQTPTAEKLLRNKIYRICGWTMIVSVVLIFVQGIPALENFWPVPNPVFWFEVIAISAFGISWFVKGEAILKDQE
ncbi:MAG: hypothetical protein N2F24_02285 [Deltaproteobacteria bacterium]